MEIYSDYVMPPFARLQWASKAIKDKYEPMFNKAKQFYWEMEQLSVIHDLRKVTTAHINHWEYPERVRSFLKEGLTFIPVTRSGNYSGYSYYHPPVTNNDWSYYGVLAKNVKDGYSFLKASQDETYDDLMLGELLGYPSCCTCNYNKDYDKGIRDTVWQKSLELDDRYIIKKEDNLIEIAGIPWYMNSLLNKLSLSVFFFTECGLNCPNAEKVAKSWIELGEHLNIAGLEELSFFLSLPVEWDSYKGIAYLKTPLFKASVNSNMSSERYRVRIHGSYFPMDARRGLEYPWDNQTRMNTIKRNDNKLPYEVGGL